MTRVALLLTACTLVFAQAQEPARPRASRPGAQYHAPSATTPAARIIREIKEHQEAVSNLETLCDTIGPRLTGSERLLKAHDWAEAKLKSYGLTVLPREAYDFGPSWTRGTERARLLTHSQTPIHVAQLAWSPATKGVLKGEVISLNLSTDLDGAVAMIGHFKGKILLASTERQRGSGDAAANKAKRDQVMKAIKEEGLAAVLTVSEKSNGLHNMTGSPRESPWWPFPKVPTGFLTAESAGILKRLLARKERVELELELGGVTGAKAVQAYNTLAELRGSEKPEEIVLLGAHMDSWDLGTGATDNGTGTVAVMEALRAIQATGLKPKRTIRIALFSGEEQGLFGSKAYVKAHEAELPKHQAVLIDDLGGGRVKGFALQNREDLRPFMARAISPLQELGVKDLPLEGSFDSDHGPFTRVGVPAFFGIQELVDYFSTTHHSQADTFEHVKPEDLIQGTTAMAVTAWELANMAERLPHAPSAK